MKNPRIKTKDQSDERAQFGRLLEPDDNVSSDEELYAAVDRHGKALIVCTPPGNPMLYEEHTRELSPEEFERSWRGD